MALFREWSNQVFDSLWFWKHISYDNHSFFQNVQNLMKISGKEEKIDKKFSF